MSESSGDGYSKKAGIFIKPHAVHPPHETAQMESAEIMRLLHSLDPGGTYQAGHHFAQVGEALNDIATRIAKHAKYISRHWRGKGATASVRKLREMHDYVAELAAQANQAGEAMKWLANDVMPHYKRLTAPHTIPGVTKEHANHVARSYLDSFSSHVITANNHIPSHIVGMNPARRTEKKPPPTGQPPVNGGPVGGGPPPPVTGSPPVQRPPVKQPPSPAGPVTTPPPGGHLQSVTAPAATGSPAAPVPAATPGGPGIVPMTGGAGGSLGDPLPATRAAGSAGADGAAGAAGEATGAEAAGAAGAEGEGMAAMPMTGGAGGQSEQERQRQAWMQEDKDIWGVPSDAGAPPLLG